LSAQIPTTTPTPTPTQTPTPTPTKTQTPTPTLTKTLSPTSTPTPTQTQTQTQTPTQTQTQTPTKTLEPTLTPTSTPTPTQTPTKTQTPTPTPTPTITSCTPQTIYNGEKRQKFEQSMGTSFKSDGSILYTSIHNGFPTDNISAYSLSTPWNVSTINTTKIANSIGFPLVGNSSVNGHYFSPDGNNLFLAQVATPNTGVYKYTLSTPWDVSTSSYSSGNFASITAGYLDFTPDGLFMFGSGSGKIKKYSLLAPWVINTGVEQIQERPKNYFGDFTFQNNGTYLFSMIQFSSTPNTLGLQRETLSTPYDLTSINDSLTQKLSLGSIVSSASNFHSINFKDGYKLFISGYFPETSIWALNLTCEYDISSAII
jgi:hypothetical protein